MVILRPDEIRKMTSAERFGQLDSMWDELMRERAVSSAGGAPENPGRIREIRRTIARIKTIEKELMEENQK